MACGWTRGSTWLAALQGQQEAEGKCRRAAAPAKLPRPQADTMLSPEQLQLIIDHFEKVGSEGQTGCPQLPGYEGAQLESWLEMRWHAKLALPC